MTADAAFEGARLAFCERIYEREAQRKESLERKAQFQLSLVTLVLGALVLQFDVVRDARAIMTTPGVSPWLVATAALGAIVLASALAFTLFAVLEAMRTRAYRNEYPAHPLTDLFDPGEGYFDEPTEGGVRRATAWAYAYALEKNRAQNNIKARWVGLGAAGLVALAAGLLLFVGALVAAIFATGGVA